jgi:endonuclease/exonuclease/phosphatase family metal-dependent hydrolase
VLANTVLRILHWNVHSWKDDAGQPSFAAIAGFIAGQDPDVVSLVEVSEPWAAPGRLPELARRTGSAWVFFPAVELGGDAPERGYGNALLVRPALLAVQQWTVTWPPRVYDRTEPSEARTVALARVPLGDDALWVGSTHLPSSRRDQRIAALSRLLDVTGKLGEPWLICGDFNEVPDGWLGPGRRGPDERVRVYPDPPQLSHPARFPVRAIDYCVASPGLAVTARVLPAPGSDHLPVLVQVERPAASAATAGPPA